MPRFITPFVLLALTAHWAAASDPKASQAPRTTGPRVVAKPNPCLVAMRRAEARDRQLVRDFAPHLSNPNTALAYFTWTYHPGYCLLREIIPFLSEPQPQLAYFLYSNDPNVRTNQLLNESEDLRQAREEMHRFWMNNQPAVLEYKRLNGAIGP